MKRDIILPYFLGLAGIILTGCEQNKQIREEAERTLTSPTPNMGRGYLETDAELPVYERGIDYAFFKDTLTMAVPIKWGDPILISQALKEQLPESYVVTPFIDSNQILVNIPTFQEDLNTTTLEEKVHSGDYSLTENVKKLIEFIDIEPAQYRIQAYIVRVNASNTKKLNAALNLFAGSDESSAELDFSFIETADPFQGGSLGVAGILTRGVSEYSLDLLLDSFNRQGYAKDLSTPTIIARHEATATNQSSVKFPVPEQKARFKIN